MVSTHTAAVFRLTLFPLPPFSTLFPPQSRPLHTLSCHTDALKVTRGTIFVSETRPPKSVRVTFLALPPSPPWLPPPPQSSWHPLSNPPHLVNAVIEIPRGCKVKYELDKETGMLKVDRVLYSSVMYPHNYGFIPRTLCEDNDPLDVLVLMQEPVVPMAFLRVIPIGVMHMLDQGERDDKLIAVHADDPAFCNYKDIAELPSHITKEIKRFFTDYKLNEGKEVAVRDLFDGADVAKRVVEESMDLYSQMVMRGIHGKK